MCKYIDGELGWKVKHKLLIYTAQPQSDALFVPTAYYMLLWYRKYCENTLFLFQRSAKWLFKEDK